MVRPETLLAATLLEEKIGQLTMAAADHAVTGPILSVGLSADRSRLLTVTFYAVADDDVRGPPRVGAGA